MTRTVLLIILIAAASFPGSARSQTIPADPWQPRLVPRVTAGPQTSDTAFRPPIAVPAYPAGQGPIILVNEAHHNFHTTEGRYAPFADVLRRDGYIVEPLKEKFNEATLRRARVLVIANALAEENQRRWSLPTPSAFSPDEIEAVQRWVAEGGSVLLIADHMPFPGAAADLAAGFGILFTNGYATDRTASADEFVFRRVDKTLADHPITRGRRMAERVDSAVTFTGQAFRSGPQAVGFAPLLTVPQGSIVLMPDSAWQFSPRTPRLPADGMVQAAVVAPGRGRVAVFGEAAMFSAQVSGAERRPMGMNVPAAAHNPQLLLNVMHWLTELLPAQ